MDYSQPTQQTFNLEELHEFPIQYFAIHKVEKLVAKFQ